MKTSESGGGEVRAAKLALISIGLAAAVKFFIHARGAEPTPLQTGGWEEIDFTNET